MSDAFDDGRVDRYYGDVSTKSVIRVIQSIPVWRQRQPRYIQTRL